MYGENSALLRAELSTLLRQHRILQRIGGAGIFSVPVTTTTAEREEIGKTIRRYRQVVLLWAHQALDASTPGRVLFKNTLRDPVDELRWRLDRALANSKPGLPRMEELATPQRFELVDAWRKAARAAALGEHDFAAGVGLGRLDRHQCRTVVYDAAEVTHALVVLDKRYANIPGWQPLTAPGHLRRAAVDCAAYASCDGLDYTADRIGWPPRPSLIEGPGRPGIAGVVQAQHNLLVHLRRFPTALNFKRILDSQRDLSHQLALRVQEVDPELAQKWHTRAATYTRVFAEARNLGGLIGGGGGAAAEGAFAISRLRKVAPDEPIPDHVRQHLDQLCDRIDARLVAIVDHGAHQALYLIKAKAPAIEDRHGTLVRGPQESFVPITNEAPTDLINVMHQHLLPRPTAPSPPKVAERSRREFREAIAHKPDRNHALGM